MRLRKLGILALVGALAALVLVLPAGPAFATRNLVCQAAGSTNIVPVDSGASYNWSLEGSGECVGGIQGILTLSLTGEGTSATLGLCSGHVIVQSLVLNMKLLLTNHKTGVTTEIDELWDAAATTYPTVTPFLVESSPGNTVGAGALFDHIFAILDPVADLLGKPHHCPPDGGAASTLFAWVQQTKNL